MPQNHSREKVGRALWGSPGPTPCPSSAAGTGVVTAFTVTTQTTVFPFTCFPFIFPSSKHTVNTLFATGLLSIALEVKPQWGISCCPQ